MLKGSFFMYPHSEDAVIDLMGYEQLDTGFHTFRELLREHAE